MKMFFARGQKIFKPGAGARLQCPTSLLRHRNLKKKVKKRNLIKLVLTGLQRREKAGALILMFPRALGM